MDSQEQHLIEDLFARLRSASGGPKDRDAEQLIRDILSRFPDAPYYLTQSVLVQQQALDRAEARIKELEAAGEDRSASASRGSSSFLGGSSVPQTGAQTSYQTGRRYADAETSPDPARATESPWASQPSRTGSFLGTALSTATGVAGGMFIADSIRNLFGGGSSASASETQAKLDRAQDDAQDAQDDADKARKDLAADDAALDDMQDEQDDDWSDDDGSMDV
ncbi:putative periplasmic ligand-binding sensor protein [Hyphomicrobium denitrificans ATCC 51888]|uniref:Putative periplasmic ligand-binding sensor protein n=1 Tax=Hyphomicrobium denitrificans (strain ATCC 51888 / DSM 1869 / NCIMB 11706 / TK 0415) TaxID=582899 RepID=D8JQI5_HYPDA|nr:DUF2076 domain-containing protein [Hyphomicrobium denitrificans]ADJ23939.1 putative periplasmic ligand-binding sensor protein [Hyphomicrobium denitrificans ATCC 51888]